VLQEFRKPMEGDRKTGRKDPLVIVVVASRRLERSERCSSLNRNDTRQATLNVHPLLRVLNRSTAQTQSGHSGDADAPPHRFSHAHTIEHDASYEFADIWST